MSPWAGTKRSSPARCKPRHNRLCWLSRKRTGKWACIQRLKAKDTGSTPLVKRTPMAVEIDCRALTNRVNRGEVWTWNGAMPATRPLCKARQSFLYVSAELTRLALGALA
jgi:hypothetical protein